MSIPVNRKLFKRLWNRSDLTFVYFYLDFRVVLVNFVCGLFILALGLYLLDRDNNKEWSVRIFTITLSSIVTVSLLAELKNITKIPGDPKSTPV